MFIPCHFRFYASHSSENNDNILVLRQQTTVFTENWSQVLLFSFQLYSNVSDRFLYDLISREKYCCFEPSGFLLLFGMFWFVNKITYRTLIKLAFQLIFWLKASVILQSFCTIKNSSSSCITIMRWNNLLEGSFLFVTRLYSKPFCLLLMLVSLLGMEDMCPFSNIYGMSFIFKS